jgi:hypothetical protein
MLPVSVFSRVLWSEIMSMSCSDSKRQLLRLNREMVEPDDGAEL